MVSLVHATAVAWGISGYALVGLQIPDSGSYSRTYKGRLLDQFSSLVDIASLRKSSGQRECLGDLRGAVSYDKKPVLDYFISTLSQAALSSIIELVCLGCVACVPVDRYKFRTGDREMNRPSSGSRIEQLTAERIDGCLYSARGVAEPAAINAVRVQIRLR